MITEWNEGLRSYLSNWTLFHSETLACLVLVSFVVFAIDEVDYFKFLYLILLPVVNFAVKDGYVAAAFSVPVSDLLMMGILCGLGSTISSATELQFLMLALSITGLLLEAAISDRARAVEELEISHQRLQDSQAVLLQASRLSLAN